MAQNESVLILLSETSNNFPHLIEKVFSYLGLTDLYRLRQVSTGLKSVAQIAYKKRYDEVLNLITPKHDPNFIDIRNGRTVIWKAAEKSSLDFLYVLVNEFPECVEWEDHDGLNAIHAAAKEGQLEALKILLQIGNANLDMKTNNRQTALHLAIQNGHPKTAEYLIAKGAKINEKAHSTSTIPYHVIPIYTLLIQFLHNEAIFNNVWN